MNVTERQTIKISFQQEILGRTKKTEYYNYAKSGTRIKSLNFFICTLTPPILLNSSSALSLSNTRKINHRRGSESCITPTAPTGG